MIVMYFYANINKAIVTFVTLLLQLSKIQIILMPIIKIVKFKFYPIFTKILHFQKQIFHIPNKMTQMFMVNRK